MSYIPGFPVNSSRCVVVLSYVGAGVALCYMPLVSLVADALSTQNSWVIFKLANHRACTSVHNVDF